MNLRHSALRNNSHGMTESAAGARGLLPRLGLAALLAALLTASASAQQPRPAPEEANSRAANAQADEPNEGQQPITPEDRRAQRERERAAMMQPDPAANTRRASNGDKVVMAFNEVSVDETIPFIVETTGKVVMPINLPMLKSKTITIVNDEPIDRQVALDMLFTAFRLNEIGVIESEEVIILNDLSQILRTGDLPVLRSNSDVSHRRDRGTIVIKIYKLVNANAEFVGERIAEMLPDYATMTIDANSNQIVVLGDIGLMQQVQKLINELDDNYIEVKIQTFRLAHADAAEIADNIYELFEGYGEGTTTGQRRPTTRSARPTRAAAQQAATQAAATVGPVVEMRVTVNSQNNSVTVQGSPTVVTQIGNLIAEEWDLPRPHGTSKVYDLKYTDPLIVRDTLREVLGLGGAGAGAARSPGGARAGAAQRTDVAQVVSGIYRVEAFAEANRLVVLSKTEEALAFLDQLIESIDRPSSVGLPMIVELKHADAVSLSEELNALLQEAGGGANIPRPGRGLTGRSLEEGGGIERAGEGGGAGDAGRINFPWQQRAREDRAPESALVGQARIVPIVRQNALAILAPVAKQEPMRELIHYFDKPGRQVMISAIVAEVTLTDATALGLRLSSSSDVLAPRNIDFGLGAGAGIDFSEDGIFGSLFDSSVLDASINLNLFIQALARNQAIRVLQQPRIFTSDNQEAQFFDGQDVPFLIGTQVTDVGTVTEQFERRAVGVRLNARPRITVEGDVDLEVNLELSRVVPGTTGGGVIIDRRETTTQVVVKNGQTIVLSGILSESEQDVRRKIPILGDIPIVNFLFSSRDKETVQTELIAFITPHVVETPTENNENFNVRERERLKEIAKPLKEHDTDEERIRERILRPTKEGATNVDPSLIDVDDIQ